ncbi:MAG: hypothetical protein QOH71_965 [Blastocatellia bacterium]|jgi:uncharacterized protein YecE (DUF72 family)|nr:hypothetical protein [Blastocatellia bacterium]
MKPQIGTCGFGIARSKYAQLFSCVEVQHTFYQPPRISTLERWREDAPADFEFVLKAWQLITHGAKSPTYRRLKRKLSEVEKQDAGYFRPTPIVKDAWQVTLACARALRARTILFQCPASFTQTKENISHLEMFFRDLNREHEEKFNFGWEPRGTWDSKVVKSLCENLKLWHVVDPFITRTLTPRRLYFRLHGRNGWRYEYEETELRELAAMFPESLAKHNRGPRSGGPRAIQKPYVFFNNARMTKDALSLQALIQE